MYLPMSRESSIFYKRRLSNYNLTFYNISNKDCYCFLWDETQKISSEISTSVYTALKLYDSKGIKNISLRQWLLWREQKFYHSWHDVVCTLSSTVQTLRRSRSTSLRPSITFCIACRSMYFLCVIGIEIYSSLAALYSLMRLGKGSTTVLFS